MKSISFTLLFFVLSLQLFSQLTPLEQVQGFRESNEQIILQEFFAFLSIPNVATDSATIGRNAVYLSTLMKKRGIGNISFLKVDDPKAPPVVFGEVKVPGATKTIMFYAHYDGQPVNSALWLSGLDPFRPQLVNGNKFEGASIVSLLRQDTIPGNWRIYARGASDDKGGVMAVLAAYEAIAFMKTPLSCNIKFIFEGEEEQGSPHLRQILEKYKDQLAADLWIICDGPVHQSGSKQVVFGARGDTHLTLKVYGPKNPLHSGHYGNWTPNPVMTLVTLLSSLKDDKGRVTVKNFYKDVTPLTASEKNALAQVPSVDAELKKRIGFSHEEMPGVTLMEAINLPSLNINGIESSNVGTIQANVIPVSATAVLDLRLVLGNDWQKQQQKVIDHIISKGFYVTEFEPTDEERSRYDKIIKITRGFGDNAQRTSMDWPIASNVVAAIQQTTKLPVLRIPTLGGSLPLSAISEVLGAKTLIVPIANADNNQHAENENITLKNFREGIDMMGMLMLMKL
jgi:acetylornithine deacetylase/succinyl-diaminopimelate desuccinylase-like protein